STHLEHHIHHPPICPVRGGGVRPTYCGGASAAQATGCGLDPPRWAVRRPCCVCELLAGRGLGNVERPVLRGLSGADARDELDSPRALRRAVAVRAVAPVAASTPPLETVTLYAGPRGL